MFIVYIMSIIVMLDLVAHITRSGKDDRNRLYTLTYNHWPLIFEFASK